MSQLEITECKRIDRQQPRWVAPRGPYDRGRMSPSYREYQTKPRLYVHVDGEGIVENLAFRTNRPAALYRSVLKQAFAELGIPGDARANWSQKAGCSCGCSPGFVLTWPSDIREQAPRADYFVTVTGGEGREAQVVPTAEAMQEAGSRLAQLDRQGVLDALKAAAPDLLRTARSGSGNLRNLKAMNEDKFRAVAQAVVAEDNDPEALEAVKAEALRRATA